MSQTVLWLEAMLNLSLHSAIGAIQSETSEIFQRDGHLRSRSRPAFSAHKRRRGFNTAQDMSQTLLWLEAMLNLALHSAIGAIEPAAASPQPARDLVGRGSRRWRC